MARTYVATEDLKIGNVTAYPRGAEVSEEALKTSDDNGFGWRDFVVGEATKTAAKVQAEETGKDK